MRQPPEWTPIAAAIGHPSLDSDRATGNAWAVVGGAYSDSSSAAYCMGAPGYTWVHSQRRIPARKHGAVTSEQRTASRDEPRTPGEKMMAAYLDERECALPV